jgi:hypothetical protein
MNFILHGGLGDLMCTGIRSFRKHQSCERVWSANHVGELSGRLDEECGDLVRMSFGTSATRHLDPRQ